MLRSIFAYYPHDSRADRMMLQGRWRDALEAFRDSTSDNSIVVPQLGQPDPVVNAGVKLALSGDTRAAIHVWARAPDGGGPYDLGSLQRALIGMGYAHLGWWPSAEEYLLAAARYRRATPDDDFDMGNLTAFCMLYAYRAHFARGEHRYSWPTLPR